MVLFDPVEMLHVVGATQKLHKVLVMGDDEQLEVTLPRATLDDSAKYTADVRKIIMPTISTHNPETQLLIVEKSWILQ